MAADTDDDVREMHDVDVVPIPVVVHAEPQEQEAAADKSSWQTITLKGDGSSPVGMRQRLLGQLDKRHKAQIIVYGTAGDYIIVGRERQSGNSQGARIYVGTGPVPVESKSAVFINGYNSVSTNDIFVTVIEELYV